MKKRIHIILNIVFIGFFVYLFKDINLQNLKNYLYKLDLINIIIVFFFFNFTYILKSFRIFYLNKGIGILKSIYITFVHNFFLTLLPFKLGELIYIKKMKEHNIKSSKGFSDIVTIRLYDMVILSIFILGLFSLMGFDFKFFTLFFLVGVFVVFYLMFFKTSLLIKFILYIKDILNIKILNKILRFFVDGFEHMAKLGTKDKIIILFLSSAIWLVSFIPRIMILHFISGINILDGLLVVLVSLVFSFLPINSVGGLGTINVGWIAGLAIINVPYELSSQISMFLYSVFILQLVLNYGFANLVKFKI